MQKLIESSEGDYHYYHTQINMYLGTTLNDKDNCIIVDPDTLTKTAKISVSSLVNCADKEKVRDEQLSLIGALILKLNNGDPVSDRDPLLIYKLHALFRIAIDKIFWLNESEKEHRSILASALQKHMRANFGMRKPRLRLSESPEPYSTESGSGSPQRKINLDVNSISFNNFGTACKDSLETPTSKNLKIPENIFYKKSSVSKNLQAKLPNPELIQSEENSIKTSNKHQRILNELSFPGLEIFRYVWIHLCSTSSPIPLNKLNDEIALKELKSEMIKKISKAKIRSLKEKIEKEFDFINLFLDPGMTHLVEQQICRMSLMKVDDRNKKALAADIDRLIGNIEVQIHDRNILKLGQASPSQSVEVIVLDKVERFNTWVKFLLKELITREESLNKLINSDCLIDEAKASEGDRKNEIQAELEKIIHEEISTIARETFFNICEKFLNYLLPEKKKRRSLSLKEKLASLILLINQEYFTLSSKAVLECLPSTSMEIKKEKALIKLFFQNDGSIELNVISTIIPAKDSGIGSFEIIVDNKIYRSVKDPQMCRSNVSISIKEKKEKNGMHKFVANLLSAKESNVPFFVTESLRKVGFEFSLLTE